MELLGSDVASSAPGSPPQAPSGWPRGTGTSLDVPHFGHSLAAGGTTTWDRPFPLAPDNPQSQGGGSQGCHLALPGAAPPSRGIGTATPHRRSTQCQRETPTPGLPQKHGRAARQPMAFPSGSTCPLSAEHGPHCCLPPSPQPSCGMLLLDRALSLARHDTLPCPQPMPWPGSGDNAQNWNLVTLCTGELLLVLVHSASPIPPCWHTQHWCTW